MKLSKGIEDIRRIRATNEKGWHIFTEIGYLGFRDETLNSLLADKNSNQWTITGFTGNGLCVKPTEV